MLARSSERGVALIVVLWVIMLLSLLIAGFAFTMHVETELTSFNRKQLKAEMMARSAIEVVRVLLIRDSSSATEGGFDSLDQFWATNDVFYVAHALDGGFLDITVRDEESKFPIKQASPDQVRRLLGMMGVDPVDADVIADSIVDWTDENDLHLLNGAEDEYYQSLDPPYRAKNAPIERVEELLLVRGVTEEIMYGNMNLENRDESRALVDLVTASSSGRVNVNTASPFVLQAFLALNDLQMDILMSRREGADGVVGTEDDQPFLSLGDFYSSMGESDRRAQQRLGRFLTVQSTHFSVQATARLGVLERAIWATLKRDGAQVQVLSWQERPGSS